MVRILNESGHERNRNAGDEAYFATMVDLFRQAFNTVEIKVFSDRPEHDKKRYNVQTVYSGGTLKRSFKSIVDVIKAIKWCDVYVWGAGQILRDDNFILSPPYRLSRPLIAKLMGKPVMAYGVGIGPLETKIIRFLARHVLNRFDLITYRDNTSGEILKSLKLAKPAVKATVDPAFGLKPADDMAIDQLMDQLRISKKERIIGIAPFGPVFRGTFHGIRNFLPAKYQADHDIWEKGGKKQYARHIKMLAEAFDTTVRKYDVRLVFIIQDASGQGLDDKISKDIIGYMQLKRHTFLLNADDFPPALIKGFMGRMVMVIGGRMHSLILASGIGVPVVAICYEKKISAFGTVIDQNKNFINGYQINHANDLNQIIEDAWKNRREIKNALITRMAEIQKEVQRNVTRLMRLL